MNKYIFTYPDRDEEGIFRDFTSDDAKKIIDYLPSHKQFDSKLIETIKRGCLSYKLNSRFAVPFQSVFYNLESYTYSEENIYHILVPTTSISRYSIDYLEKFKRRHSNVRLYAIVTDSMHASSPHMDLVRAKLLSGVWDKVLTYDRYDAQEYGFIWFGYTYYSSFDYVEPDPIRSDLYYVGFDKGGRHQLVNNIYELVRARGCTPRFDVVSSNKKTSSGGFRYLERKISYPEVVSRVKSTNCILEVLQEGQQSQSLRYFEAIAYNKKLLTNNRHIKELPWYDERYMRHFKDIDQIDTDWIKERTDIEYGYNNEFSPLRLIVDDHIVKDLNGR